MAEQQSSSAGGQDKKKKIGYNNPTDLIGSQTSLTGTPTGLTGTQTGLTGVSCKLGNYSKAKKRIRPSFEELIVKYEHKGAVQKQKSRPYSTRGASSLPKHQEQQGSHQRQSNRAAAAPYPVGSYMPLPWSYPSYCASSDYNSMNMQPYFFSYLNYGAL